MTKTKRQRNKYPRYFVGSDRWKLSYPYSNFLMYILLNNKEYMWVPKVGDRKIQYEMSMFLNWVNDKNSSKEITEAEAALLM